MPEGDVLHRAARRLQLIVGERVEAESPSPRGRATGVAAAADGRTLESVEAIGKNLVLRFEGGIVVRSHLRMRGRWRVLPREAPVSGSPWLVLRGGPWQAVQWNGPVLSLVTAPLDRIGPDVLGPGSSVGMIARRLRGCDPDRAIGDALLDQGLVAGIGTVWMAESLWQAGVSPLRPVGRVTDEELGTALGWAQRAMRASVSGPRPGRAVYRRSGRPCPRCGGIVRRSGIGDQQRAGYHCPGCQT